MNNDQDKPEDQPGLDLQHEPKQVQTDPFLPDGVIEGDPNIPSALEAAEPRENKKTRRKEVRESRKRQQRLQFSYSSDYHDLYNQSVTDSLPNSGEFPGSKNYGLVAWTSDEVEEFFHAISRKGRHNVQAIASIITTKSEIEVQAFLQILEKEVVRESLGTGRYLLLECGQIPAACEVSEECEQALEIGAAGLAYKQFNHEIDIEIGRYRDFWILDLRAEERLSQAQDDAESMQSQPSEDPKLQQAFQLLDLRQFITLSFRVFMNSQDQDGNWRGIAKSELSPSLTFQGPSLFCTAFLDFHNLVVGITRRLVSSCIFAADSRHRLKPKAAREITVDDAKTAVDILGLPRNGFHFWQGVPRRCNLKVHAGWVSKKEGHGGNLGRILSLEEVEEEMEKLPSRLSKGANADEEVEYDSASDSPSGFGSPTMLSVHEKEMERRAMREKAEDEYVEVQDMKESRKDEEELWNVLKRKPVEQLVPPSDAKMKKPLFTGRRREEFIDWKDWCEYKSEWESFTEQPARKTFEKNQRYGREEVPVTATIHDEQVPDTAVTHDEQAPDTAVPDTTVTHNEQVPADEDTEEDGAWDSHSSSAAGEDGDGDEKPLSDENRDFKQNSGRTQSELLHL